MYLSESFGYAKVDNINKYKPYAYVVGYTKSAFDNTTLKLVSGRLPENNKEIIVSVPFKNSAKVKIGDTISLDIGKRVCTDGTILNQSNPYYVEEGETDLCHEYITDTSKHEYKIVGITERLNYNIEGYSAPGYTLITKIDKVSDNINVSLLFKDAKYYKEYINNIANDNDLNKYNITLPIALMKTYKNLFSNSTLACSFLSSSVPLIGYKPIVEELLFRGIIFNKINEYFSLTVAILVSSFLFGISHEFGGMFSAFVFGNVILLLLYF